MAAFTVCFLLALFSFSAGVLQAEEERRENAELNLQHLLSRAHSLGIVTERQVTELKNLASDLGGKDNEGAKLQFGGEGKEDGGDSSVYSSAFLQMYNRLTLMNILYFSGALLTMGAYTLFTTLAWESFGFGGLGVFMLVQVLALGGLGMNLWIGGEYQFLGGLLCSVSTTMVPFTVYCIERALNWWPKEDPGLFQTFQIYVRGSWVVVEISTILTGLVYLSIVKFPFLLFPVSWMLWFLSMDLAPFLPEWYRGWRGILEARRQLSVVFGLAMIIAGRLLEIKLGADPDFGFWLYLFGLLTFWFAVTFDFPEYDLHGSLYLLLNIAFCLVGSHLDRNTFHVFSMMGISVYTVGIFMNHIKVENSFLLWFLKAFAAAGLLSQALRTGGNIEILAALVCILAFNFNALRFLGSGKRYNLFLLVTNLGFVACIPAFQRPIDLWFFIFPNASWPVGFVCSLSVSLFHVGLLRYFFRPVEQGIPILYHLYRLVGSVCIALVFVFFRQPSYAWVGGLGVPLVATNFSTELRSEFGAGRRSQNYKNVPHKFVAFVIFLLGIAQSIYLETNILYFVCCFAMMSFVLSQMKRWKIGGCVFATALVLLSVPLQSKFIIVIGVIYIFTYLTHLAYEKFKNSIAFSLILISMGLSIMYLGYLYQTNEVAVGAFFELITPNALKVILNRPLSVDWKPLGMLDWYHVVQQTEFSYDSLVTQPYSWIAWPAALVHALSKGTVPYVSYMCAIGIALLFLALAVSKCRQSLVKNLDSEVTGTSMTIALSQDKAHNQHGIIVKLKGEKRSSIARPAYIALNVTGNSFWNVASSTFGEWKVSLARSMFLPLTLTPHLISFVGFEKGSTQFTATVLLGTGHKGSARLSHATAKQTLQKLKTRNSDAAMTCSLLYSNNWYSPYSKLSEKEISLSNIKF